MVRSPAAATETRGRIGAGPAIAVYKSEGNMKQYQEYTQYRERYSLYLKLRKWTVPIHWAFGILCAVMFIYCWPAAVVMMLLFAMWEWWNDKNLKENLGNDYKKEGDQDWWDSFFTFCMGISVAAILHGLGLITITWWHP
jgi:ABC-type Fe3+ transport system permease subunit